MADAGDGLLGLDSRSLQEIYYQRNQQRQQKLMDQIGSIGYRDPASNSAAQLGGMLGLALQQRVAPGAVLTPQDRQGIAIRDRANAIFTKKLQDNPDMTDEDKALTMQMSAADAYRENGVYDKYNQLVLDASMKKRQRAQAEAQQKILDSEVHDINNKQVMSDVAMQKAVAGQSQDFFLQGEDPLTAEPKAGKILSDGTMEYRDNNGGTKYFQDFIPADTAIHLANLRREAGVTKAAGALKPHDVWRPEDVSAYRDMTAGAALQSRTIGRVSDTLAELMDKGQNPNEILGLQGKALSTISNLVSGLKSVSDYAGQLVDVTTGKTTFSGSIADKSFMAQMGTDPLIKAAIDGIQVPDSIKGAKEADLYKGQITQLAYAVWRSMEGAGAKSASNQDFANALNAIGAGSGNMTSLMGNLDAIMKNGTDKLKFTFNGARQQGRDFLGWDESKVDTFLFQGQFQKTMNEVERRRSRMKILTGQPPIGVPPDVWNRMNKDEQDKFKATLVNREDE